MRVCNVLEIFDNGEFVTLVLNTLTTVHLPEGKHSITAVKRAAELFDVTVDLHEGGVVVGDKKSLKV